jgi:hypothetical protein
MGGVVPLPDEVLNEILRLRERIEGVTAESLITTVERDDEWR